MGTMFDEGGSAHYRYLGSPRVIDPKTGRVEGNRLAALLTATLTTSYCLILVRTWEGSWGHTQPEATKLHPFDGSPLHILWSALFVEHGGASCGA